MIRTAGFACFFGHGKWRALIVYQIASMVSNYSQHRDHYELPNPTLLSHNLRNFFLLITPLSYSVDTVSTRSAIEVALIDEGEPC